MDENKTETESTDNENDAHEATETEATEIETGQEATESEESFPPTVDEESGSNEESGIDLPDATITIVSANVGCQGKLKITWQRGNDPEQIDIVNPGEGFDGVFVKGNTVNIEVV